MEKEIIFEIPIYSMSEEKYKRKWEEFIEKKSDGKNTYKEYLKNKYSDIMKWKYNQIIGMIVIEKIESDICFTYYKTTSKRISFKVRPKPLVDAHITGNHFNVNLVDDIDEYLSIFVGHYYNFCHYNKDNYIDLSIYNNYYEEIKKRILKR